MTGLEQYPATHGGSRIARSRARAALRWLFTAALAATVLRVGGVSHARSKASSPAKVALARADGLVLTEPAKARELAEKDPTRFAVPLPVAATPTDSGVWTKDAEGNKVWRLPVRVPGARSLNFLFRDFSLPPGASLRITGASGSNTIGPFTQADDNGRGELWTPILAGEAATIELSLPPQSDEPRLTLAQVNSGFRDLHAPTSFAPETTALPCEVDVACPDGDPWRDQIRSVALFSVNGTTACSGSMMNNTDRTYFRPLFLTSSRCGVTGASAASMVFYWNYEKPLCGGPAGSGDLSQVSAGGATLLATHTGTDFALVELRRRPASSYNVYWSGWSRISDGSSGTVSIHHPNGEEKAISGDDDAPTIVTCTVSGDTYDPSAHLEIGWDRGTTEPISTGAGLWDNLGRRIGTLTSAAAQCPPGATDCYGRLAAQWNGGGTNQSKLQPWLTPIDDYGSGEQGGAYRPDSGCTSDCPDADVFLPDPGLTYQTFSSSIPNGCREVIHFDTSTAWYDFTFCAGGGTASFDTILTSSLPSGPAVPCQERGRNDDYCSNVLSQLSSYGSHSAGLLITVEGYEGAGGSYTLAYRRASPLEECDRIGDEDQDGYADCRDPDCEGTPFCACSVQCPNYSTINPEPPPPVGYYSIQDAVERNCNRLHRFDARPGAVYRFWTCSNALDPLNTVLASYQGDCAAGPGNDDFCLLESQIEVTATSNHVYVDLRGFDGKDGPYVLNASMISPPPENCTNGVDDDGDFLVDCVDPDCSADPVCQFCMTTCPAFDLDHAEPQAFWSTTTGSVDPGCHAIHRFATTPNAAYRFTFCDGGGSANFDTLLESFQSDCSPAGSDDNACQGIRSEIDVTAADSTFFLQVSGAGGASGDYTLAYRRLLPEDCSNGSDDDGDGLADCSDPDCAFDPGCDSCNAICPPSYDFDHGEPTNTYQTVTSSVEPGCHKIHRFTSSSIDHIYRMSFCEGGGTADFDTVLSRVSSACSPYTSNDDYCPNLLSQLDVNARFPGDDIFVEVRGYNGQGGNYTLAYRRLTDAEVCNNGIDDDGDGAIDCGDRSDCDTDPACTACTTACPAWDIEHPTPLAYNQFFYIDVLPNCHEMHRFPVKVGVTYRFSFCEDDYRGSGANFNTLLEAFSASCVAGPVNDDFCLGGLSQLDVTADSPYVYLRVGGIPDKGGEGWLSYRRLIPEICFNGQDDDFDGLVDCDDPDCVADPGCDFDRCSSACPSFNYARSEPGSEYNRFYNAVEPGCNRLFRFDATPGETYRFTFCDGGGSADFDTILESINAACAAGPSDDDGCPFLLSQIDVTADSPYVFVNVRGYLGQGGSFVLADKKLPREICTNLTDDDGDNLIDCADPDCAGHAACQSCSTQCPSSDTSHAEPTGAYQTVSSSVGPFCQKVHRFDTTPGRLYRFSFCHGGGSASFDTVLESASESCAAGPSDDDSCPELRSLLDVTANSNALFVVVKGFGSEGGDYELAYKRLTREDCGNQVDDDEDGRTDCDDPDCASDPRCNCATSCPEFDFSHPDPTFAFQTTSSVIPPGCHDVHSFQATPGAQYRFTFCEGGGTASFDTVLDSADASCAPGPSNDDLCQLLSQVDLTATSNLMFVNVAGFHGEGGSYTLAYRRTPPEDCTNGTDDDGDGLIDCFDPDCDGTSACVECVRVCPAFDFSHPEPTTTYQTTRSSVAENCRKIDRFAATVGQSYRFTFCEGGGTADFDTILSSGDAACARDTVNDDACPGNLSQVDVRASSSIIYVDVTGFRGQGGAYTLAYKRR